MEDVTDTVFRMIIISCGRPDLFFTEFTNVDGLASEGDYIVAQRLFFTPIEKPIIAQVWGKTPEHYFRAAKKIKKMGFDGIDINMGCPEKAVVKNGCCAALINNHSLATEIITATQEGAQDLPVSIKTRIGFGTIVTEEWVQFLLSHDIAALTVHGRIAKELSTVPARWDEIAKAVQIRDTMQVKTFIIGNGDIKSKEEAFKKIEQTHVDGIMVGRGIFQNPYFFVSESRWQETNTKERLSLLKTHVELFETVWKDKKNFSILKKYVKIYVSGFDGASEQRENIMKTSTTREMLSCIDTIESSL